VFSALPVLSFWIEWDTDMGTVGTDFLLSSSQHDDILFSYNVCSPLTPRHRFVLAVTLKFAPNMSRDVRLPLFICLQNRFTRPPQGHNNICSAIVRSTQNGIRSLRSITLAFRT
jgi:hypothetical protein